MASVIPFGQPILVGHYSEGRDRRYRDKIHNTFGKGFALDEQADDLMRRAANVGTGGISSDDPDAIDKLREKLAGLEHSQETMKAVNAALRRKDPNVALAALGYSALQVAELQKPDFCGRIGYPAYSLQNNNAEIRRIRERIKVLEAHATATDVEREYDGFTYREDTEENRVMFIFPGKPEETVRNILKRESFKWSPSRGAWVRQLNNAGKWHADQVIAALEKLTKSAEE